jgi:hypothetical protein
VCCLLPARRIHSRASKPRCLVQQQQ